MPRSLLLILLVACITSGHAQLQYGSYGYRIQIIQGQDTFNVSDSGRNEINLKRESFRFRFSLKKDRYVFFIASGTTEYYRTDIDSVFPDCMMFCGGAVGAGTMFNPDQEICVYGFSQGISCWFYDSATEHRFDGPAAIFNDGIYAERTINKLYDYKGSKKYFPLKNLSAGKVIYMVFMDMENEKCPECEDRKTGKPWRRYLKIKFL